MNPQQSGGAKKESKGFKRVWGRIKTVFKDKDAPSVSSSVVDSPARAPSPSPSPAPHVPATSQQTVADVPTPTPLPSSKMVQSSAEKRPHGEEPDSRLQKLKASLAKYDYLLSEDDDDVPITISDYRGTRDVPYERVHKNIRMRVKYTCHQCRTTYGSVKVCISCHHRRCRDCVRYPPKKKGKTDTAQEEKQAPGHVHSGSGQADAGHGIEPDPHCACHECRTGFELGAAECPNCHHQICSLCLKKPELTIAIEPEADTDWTASERAGSKLPSGKDKASATVS